MNDSDVKYVAVPRTNPEMYQEIRAKYYSRKWWMAIGFDGEDAMSVMEAIGAAVDLTGDVDGSVLYECPVGIYGDDGVPEKDIFCILFIHKRVDWNAIFRACRQNRLDAFPEQPPQQDVLILSTSLHKTAMTTYDNVLSCYSHLDN